MGAAPVGGCNRTRACARSFASACLPVCCAGQQRGPAGASVDSEGSSTAAGGVRTACHSAQTHGSAVVGVCQPPRACARARRCCRTGKWLVGIAVDLRCICCRAGLQWRAGLSTRSCRVDSHARAHAHQLARQRARVGCRPLLPLCQLTFMHGVHAAAAQGERPTLAATTASSTTHGLAEPHSSAREHT
jgi:hypothetical protein